MAPPHEGQPRLGTYVTFGSFPGVELALESLESLRQGEQPELISVKRVEVGGRVVQVATVFIPDGKRRYFFDRLQQYLDALDSDRQRNHKGWLKVSNRFVAQLLENCGLTRRSYAQAWNAITVGAYSSHDDMLGANPWQAGFAPIARRGELSPVSRTSVLFAAEKWPFKPEVVADGGNVAVSPDASTVDSPENLALLTTRMRSDGEGHFTTTRDTSAATAQVASIAARIIAAYPAMQPETVRALVVHSAEWTPQMSARFDSSLSKSTRVNLLRRYGMGVPDAQRAVRSASDALTLVTESDIHPFSGKGSSARPGSMNLHRLPWPDEELEALGATDVRLRVTLSYFIEPNPSSRGWVGRYQYPSFGLRFAVKRPEDSVDAFRERINQAARIDGTRPIQLGTELGWFFGLNQQQRPGSLHTDIWTGTAAELASKGVIAVYPVGGWWKGRAYDQSDRGVGYSLVVSVDAPGVEVDLWTAVAQKAGFTIVAPIEIAT